MNYIGFDMNADESDNYDEYQTDEQTLSTFADQC